MEEGRTVVAAATAVALTIDGGRRRERWFGIWTYEDKVDVYENEVDGGGGGGGEEKEEE